MTGEIGLLLTPPVSQSYGGTEQGFLEACRQGSLSAFESLYSAHAARMKSIAFHLLGDRSDAEDAVQETFFKVYRSIDSFDGPSGFNAWIYRILINCCYDAGRKRQRRAEEELSTEPSIAANVPLKVALQRALAKIHSGYRMVFWLFEVEGFRHSEIAGILEIPEGTSKKWLFEAKRELKRLLTEVRP